MWTVVKIWKSFTDESVKRSEVYFDFGDKYIREAHSSPNTYLEHPAMNQCFPSSQSSVSHGAVSYERTGYVLCSVRRDGSGIKLCLSASSLNVRRIVTEAWRWQVVLFQVRICGFVSKRGLPCLPLEGVQVTATNHCTEFLLFSGRRMKLVFRSPALGIAGYVI